MGQSRKLAQSKVQEYPVGRYRVLLYHFKVFNHFYFLKRISQIIEENIDLRFKIYKLKNTCIHFNSTDLCKKPSREVGSTGIIISILWVRQLRLTKNDILNVHLKHSQVIQKSKFVKNRKETDHFVNRLNHFVNVT